MLTYRATPKTPIVEVRVAMTTIDALSVTSHRGDSFSLVVRGAIMAVPQFLVALAGGCLAWLPARGRPSKETVGQPATLAAC